MARHGTRLVVTDIQKEKGQAVAKAIVDAGGAAPFFPLDVTDEQDWLKSIRHVPILHIRF